MRRIGRTDGGKDGGKREDCYRVHKRQKKGCREISYVAFTRGVGGLFSRGRKEGFNSKGADKYGTNDAEDDLMCDEELGNKAQAECRDAAVYCVGTGGTES